MLATGERLAAHLQAHVRFMTTVVKTRTTYYVAPVIPTCLFCPAPRSAHELGALATLDFLVSSLASTDALHHLPTWLTWRLVACELTNMIAVFERPVAFLAAKRQIICAACALPYPSDKESSSGLTLAALRAPTSAACTYNGRIPGAWTTFTRMTLTLTEVFATIEQVTTRPAAREFSLATKPIRLLPTTETAP